MSDALRTKKRPTDEAFDRYWIGDEFKPPGWDLPLVLVLGERSEATYDEELLRERIESAYDEEFLPLYRELAAIGIHVDSPGRVSMHSRAMQRAAPVMARALSRSPRWSAELPAGVLSALDDRGLAPVAYEPVLHFARETKLEYDTLEQRSLDPQLGATLGELTRRADIQRSVDVLLDPRHGDGLRLNLAFALAGLGGPIVEDALLAIEKRYDPVCSIEALARKPVERYRPVLEKYAASSEPWLAKKAQVGLRRLDRKKARAS